MRTYIERAEDFMNFYDFNGLSGKNAKGSFSHAGNEKVAQKSYEDKFAEFSQKSEEELTAQLLESARRMRADGTLDFAALENMYITLSPMLNDFQRERMRNIIDMLKG